MQAERDQRTCLQRTHAVTVWWTLSRDRPFPGESAMVALSSSAIKSDGGIDGEIRVEGDSSHFLTFAMG